MCTQFACQYNKSVSARVLLINVQNAKTVQPVPRRKPYSVIVSTYIGNFMVSPGVELAVRVI